MVCATTAIALCRCGYHWICCFSESDGCGDVHALQALRKQRTPGCSPRWPAAAGEGAGAGARARAAAVALRRPQQLRPAIRLHLEHPRRPAPSATLCCQVKCPSTQWDAGIHSNSAHAPGSVACSCILEVCQSAHPAYVRLLSGGWYVNLLQPDCMVCCAAMSALLADRPVFC